jgi:hypothetical protein
MQLVVATMQLVVATMQLVVATMQLVVATIQLVVQHFSMLFTVHCYCHIAIHTLLQTAFSMSLL